MSDVHQTLDRAGITVFERGWLSSNNVLIRGDRDGAVLVDSGYWTHGAQTVELVRHALQGQPLARVVNTHLHSDHCGGNAALQAAFRCVVDVPVGLAEAVDAWDEERLTYAATGQHCPRFVRDEVIDSPSTVTLGRWAWQALAAPGHDPTSLAFYQPDLQVLISADALWENGFGVVFPELEGEAAFDEVAATLDAFEALDVRMVIPGHGPPFTDMPGAIARARSRLESFVSDPPRHAMHAAKVLVKFHLLEVKCEYLDGFWRWLDGTRYFEAVHSRHFPDVPWRDWSREIVSEMNRRGSLQILDGRIMDSGG
ncbi:MBL fold metallo-hydrolase [Piscinibacter terrae]|uniref:MBL fold metallo-hydrolase n=1 Tax=Piscinibacter terrae TaxID=2496871 RepID=A0A3N7JPD7_9BURK|nr:MBL fold metallo-hydrolase [Albitalea terrae]RQP22939.1 MBL fold metallo-hydrolase [Albitalea terrae]